MSQDPSLPPWGLFDCRDKCWLGNKAGPLTYDDEFMARAAATICTTRIGRTIRAMIFTPDTLVLKDEITPPLSTEEAIDLIERRAK